MSVAQRRPIILGLVGDSAAGKTTLTRGTDEHPRSRVRDPRLHRRLPQVRPAGAGPQSGITPLRPDCNYMDILELHVERTALRPADPEAGLRSLRPARSSVPSTSSPVTSSSWRACSASRPRCCEQFYDVKVYLDPPEDRAPRLEGQAGHGQARLHRGAGARRAGPSARRTRSSFIRPQREHADIVVRFFRPTAATLDDAGPQLNVRLVLRPTIPHPDLSYLVEKAPNDGPAIRLALGRDEAAPWTSWRSTAT